MFRKIVLAICALATFAALPFPLGLAHAQGTASFAEAVRIDGFDVEPVAKPAPGNELVFTLYGSPGGSAAVQIKGATGGVVLVESEAGVYEGTYTIRKRDKITTASTAIANLRVGNKVVSVILDEPLIGKAGVKRPAAAKLSGMVPKIDRFDLMSPPASLLAGEDLVLAMGGSPGGAASARVVGVKGKIVLNEIRSGVYEGTYTIKNRDRIMANSVVTGHLRLGERETNVVLGQSLLTGTALQSQSAARQSSRWCADCGVVEAINVVEVKGQGSYLGAIAGGVAGVLIGSQIGQGAGTTVAQVAGGAGGAYVGNEIEKRIKTTKHYEVIVRLDNGGSRMISYAAQPAFAVGAKVKIENNSLTLIP